MTSVLVVDDRPADRNLVTTILGYAGYDVREAENGEEALSMAREAQPDLIISDILMPRMNGYEFVRRLREEPEIANTMVIFATANYVEGEVKRLADSCGVHHFLEKPVEPQRVISTVADAVGDADTRADPLPREDFDREQLHVLNDKLVQKVAELEEVSAARQALIVQLLNAQEDERRRIAIAIHDDPIQSASAVAMRLDALAADADNGQREAIQELRRDVGRTVDDLRDLVFELEPVALRTQGLRVALEAFLEDARADGLEFDLQMATDEPDEAAQTLLYRLAREAIANVRRHAAATRVDVIVERHVGEWMVSITDDGRGFDPKDALCPAPGHLGLASMNERLETAGGSMAIDSEPGRGSRITVKLPVMPADAGDG